jgi:hypothetical protein
LAVSHIGRKPVGSTPPAVLQQQYANSWASFMEER